MRKPSIFRGIWALLACISVLATELAAQAGPETQRCLTREQLMIEPIFSACPPLIDEASVSDNSFISKLYLDGGYDSYSSALAKSEKLYRQHYDYDQETGAYKGFCGTQCLHPLSAGLGAAGTLGVLRGNPAGRTSAPGPTRNCATASNSSPGPSRSGN
jgi:hypothetical protein